MTTLSAASAIRARGWPPTLESWPVARRLTDEGGGGALEDEELLGQRPWCGTLWIAVAPEPMIPTRFSTRPVRLPLLSPPL